MRYILSLFAAISIYAFAGTTKTQVYQFEITREIDPAAAHIAKQAINKALELKSDYILIHMNTYGGMLDAADSIRTQVLNCPVPVLVFIDHNAASAGALISIAADSIYMRPGASIGAATVVDQTGKVAPDKYQSYMRGLMRSTAEAHGKDIIINGKDTTYIWHRDPQIAEAMVDPRTYIKGVNDTGKVLTFTTDEAIAHGYCEGKANSTMEVLSQAGITNYTIVKYEVTWVDKLIGIFKNPVIQGILIMLIIAGLYFEMQAPGLGLPIIIAIGAAVLYFLPLYIEGLANNWEIIMFIAGLILIALEIFVVPGFGITGISGIVLVILGLTLAMMDKITLSPTSWDGMVPFIKPLAIVVSSITISFMASILLGSQLLLSKKHKLALHSEIGKEAGYVSGEAQILEALIGKSGKSVTILRPSGKVEVEGKIYDAIAVQGYIDPDTAVSITRVEAGQVYVKTV
jgi:membrane-bound serine protease (ClpP class)